MQIYKLRALRHGLSNILYQQDLINSDVKTSKSGRISHRLNTSNFVAVLHRLQFHFVFVSSLLRRFALQKSVAFLDSLAVLENSTRPLQVFHSMMEALTSYAVGFWYIFVTILFFLGNFGTLSIPSFLSKSCGDLRKLYPFPSNGI